MQGVLRAQEAAIEQAKGHRITAMEADKLAGALLKDGNSTYDRAELAQRIGATMDLMERGEGMSMEPEESADPVRTHLK